MVSVVAGVTLIAVALLAIEVLLVARRARTAARLAEPAWFMVFLGALGLLALPGDAFWSGVALLPLTAAMLWSAGAYFDERDEPHRPGGVACCWTGVRRRLLAVDRAWRGASAGNDCGNPCRYRRPLALPYAAPLRASSLEQGDSRSLPLFRGCHPGRRSRLRRARPAGGVA